MSAFWSAEFIKKISGEVCQPSCCLGMIISCCPSSTTGWSRVIPSITTSYKRRTWPIEAITSRSPRDEHQSKLTNRVQCKVCNRCRIFICAKYAYFLTNITRTLITLIGLKSSTFPCVFPPSLMLVSVRDHYFLLR